MKIAIAIITLGLFIFTCSIKKDIKTITINQSQKIKLSKKWDTDSDLSYLWLAPQGPRGHKAKWIIDGDIMLFTPNLPGQYTISVMVQTRMGENLGGEDFYFNVIDGSGKNTIKESSENNNIDRSISPKTISPKISKSNSINLNKEIQPPYYTIQVSSWPSFGEAKKEQLKLKVLGFTSDLTKKYIEKKDAIWWRVRVGKFKSIGDAKAVNKQIHNKFKIDTWIDRVTK